LKEYISYTLYGITNLATVASVSVDDAAIMSVNNANNQDPFYPSTSTAEQVSNCLGYCQAAGIYHYHIESGCAFYENSSKSVSGCSGSCSTNIAVYSIGMYSNYKTLIVIGIAKDGQVIYSPYNSAGTQVTSGFDACSGIFYDSVGNYGYFATQIFPYLWCCVFICQI
ncbi:unnamed protein product, partial [Didymodactylos carnosus]